MNTIQRLASAAVATLLCMVLAACSGTEVIADDPGLFAARGFNTYGWRTAALKDPGYSKAQIYRVDPEVRLAVDKRMAELGYRLVPKEQAQFLVDYIAAAGVNASRLPTGASNVNANPNTTINRLPDGASVDNAYALGGAKTTGNIAIVFVERGSADLLWKVQISTLIEDANRVDTSRLRDGIRQGLSTVPAAP